MTGYFRQPSRKGRPHVHRPPRLERRRAALSEGLLHLALVHCRCGHQRHLETCFYQVPDSGLFAPAQATALGPQSTAAPLRVRVVPESCPPAPAPLARLPGSLTSTSSSLLATDDRPRSWTDPRSPAWTYCRGGPARAPRRSGLRTDPCPELHGPVLTSSARQVAAPVPDRARGSAQAGSCLLKGLG